jgi:hypothetical protein
MSISTGMGRLTPEVTSPVDRTIMVFFVFCGHLSSTLYHFDVISAFLWPKMTVRRFRPLGGVLDWKWSHRSIAWPRFGIGRFGIFSIIFYLSKVIRLFRFGVKCLLKILGKGYFAVKNFFDRWDLQKALPWSNPRRLKYRACKSVQWSGL